MKLGASERIDGAKHTGKGLLPSVWIERCHANSKNQDGAYFQSLARWLAQDGM
jgi:hypothetical protein